MKKIAASSVIVLSLLGLLVADSAGQENGLTLPEDLMPQLRPVIENSMRQSPRMLEKNLDLAQSQAEGYMARSSSFPQAGGFANYQWQRETRVDAVYDPQTGKYSDITSKNDKYYYNFSVNQALWHWGALEASRKIARIDRELAEINYREAYRVLAAEIRASYLGLILAKTSMRNAEFTRRMAQDTLTRQQARYNSNQITYGQIMADQLKLDDASLAERRGRADFDYALGVFRSLCGEAHFSENDVPDAIADLPNGALEGGTLVVGSSDARETIRAAEMDVRRAKLGLVAPRYGLFPKLGLTAGLSRDELSRDLDIYNKYLTDTWYVGAQVSWTIFDGFANKGQKLAAYTRLRRAERRLSNLRESLERDLQREQQNVRFTWDAYQTAKVRLRMAREGVDYFRELAKRGEASQEQVDTAISSANSSHFFAQQALALHFNAVVQYLSSRGLDPLGKAAVQH